MSSKSSGPTSFGSKNSSTLKLNQGGSDWSEGNKELGSDHGESDSELSETESFLGKPFHAVYNMKENKTKENKDF